MNFMKISTDLYFIKKLNNDYLNLIFVCQIK